MTGSATLTPRVLTASSGETSPEGDLRFMIDSAETGGRFVLAEMLLAPRTLGAPVHRHSREDEFTYVTSGRLTARLGDVEVVGGPGDLIVKPRGQWHTFWNAADEPATALEIDSPGGLERMFREMFAAGDALDAAAMTELAARYGCEIDLDATGDLIDRLGLAFW